MTQSQVEFAVDGMITPAMEQVANAEGLDVQLIRQRIADGQIVIPMNNTCTHRIKGIGLGLSTKINASIGTSTDIVDIGAEVRKAMAAQQAGADTLMELSVGGNLDKVRKEVIAAVDLPVGNVPLYQAFCEAAKKYGDPNKLDEEMLFDLIERQCADGLAFMAVHCGINFYTIERLERQGYRYGGLVSKGGASMVAWIRVSSSSRSRMMRRFDSTSRSAASASLSVRALAGLSTINSDFAIFPFTRFAKSPCGAVPIIVYYGCSACPPTPLHGRRGKAPSAPQQQLPHACQQFYWY